MTAALPESSVTEGVRSLEVRWILPGPLETAVAGWFGRFPARTEAREDSYLLDPRLPGLSVKVRAGEMLEVKVYRGSPGILDVGGRARGRIQSWQKWSFPHARSVRGSADPAGWRPVAKRRRISRFSLADGRAVAGAPGPAGQLACEVELTDVRMRGASWWTLGLEATGPADLLRSGLEATAAVVFAQSIPGGAQLGPDDSRSYAEWLDHEAGADGRDDQQDDAGGEARRGGARKMSVGHAGPMARSEGHPNTKAAPLTTPAPASDRCRGRATTVRSENLRSLCRTDGGACSLGHLVGAGSL
jgi:hypothetical protein